MAFGPIVVICWLRWLSVAFPAREVRVLSSDGSADAGRIFISYRRDDADFAAGWLSDRLMERYGADRVFEDVHSILLGADFVEVIVAAVQSCAVLLALIGKRWLVDENGQRRIDKPDDFVRLEIRTALQRNVTVIPVLLDGVQMPDAAHLPPDLKELANRNAHELHAARFEADNEPLLSRLDGILAPVVPHSSAVQAGNVPTLASGSEPPGSKVNPADSARGGTGNPGFPAGFHPESYAEVAPRQAAIQADLNQHQAEEAASPPTAEQARRAPQPSETKADGDSAEIVINRETSYAGSAWSWQVLLDGQNIGMLANGGSFTFQASPGHHAIVVGPASRLQGNRSEEFHFDADAGERIELGTRGAVWRPRLWRS